MQELHIYRRRIRQFIDRVHERRYGERSALEVAYTYDKNKPIPYGSLSGRTFKPIPVGTRWGELWASAWFKVTGVVPESFSGSEVVALINLGSEGCIFVDGSPVRGLTDGPRTPGQPTGKRRVPIVLKAKGGERVDILIEAGANSLFGYRDHHDFILRQCELAVFDRAVWQLGLDLDYLYKLADALPADSVRTRRLWRGLNDAANAWRDGAGVSECAAICRRLLSVKAGSSATTAWSVGHAHIDLGWLWPVWESRRKAGRTFSTALRLIEEYPDYVFGSSQPQAYHWVKEDYPQLYKQIGEAVRSGRWECQGAMWVEPDMNITGGESLVRQLLFGKRFFREEFGKDVTNLWLPDVFGYSAALPQILRLAGVTTFMTQKISWNESNTFPHHSFIWEGIDGTRIRTHFLPTNTYNANNEPKEMIGAEARFAQADISGDWLNLYGVGDGGGGPGRYHLEMARRGANTDGSPKVKLSGAEEFFSRLHKIPESTLPLWRGELYLELHRGTYTTQSRMKRYNRLLEGRLHDAEFLAAVAGVDQIDETAAVWRDTMLNQFHDILPGSSITLVYDEAHEQSERHLTTLGRLIDASMRTLHGSGASRTSSRTARYAVQNTLSWSRRAVVLLPDVGPNDRVTGPDGSQLPRQTVKDGTIVAVNVPPMGHATVAVATGPGESTNDTGGPVTVRAEATVIENSVVRVRLANDGTIASIYDIEHARETLAGPANRLLLWEDYPYSWDAWDISHYYRETTPEQAKLVSRTVVETGPLRAVIAQRLKIGGSTIDQSIVLEAGSRLVRIDNTVDWNESHKQLRVAAQPAVHALSATYEIQFGAVSRPGHANTSWDAAQFEVAAQRFADVSQADYGFGVVNDCKYGHSFRDGIIDLTLLRSPKDPDPVADIGTHEFAFGYYPHSGTWSQSALLETAHELNSPPLVARSADRGASSSWFDIVGGRVKIETVKLAEDRKGTILRLYETRGETQRVVLRSALALDGMIEVDLLEQGNAKVKGVRAPADARYSSEVALEFGPYQIRSFRIGR